VLGFITRALANWAAPSFISGAIVVAAILVRRERWSWISASLGLGLCAQALFLAGDAVAPRLNVPWMANGDIYHRTLGWRSLGEQAGALARKVGARSIVAEQRDDEASLLYYWRDQPEKVYAWPHSEIPDHQFDLTNALTDAAAQPVLFISRCGEVARIGEQFATIEPVGSFTAPTGPKSSRLYVAYKLDGRRGPIRPIRVCGS
jgi:hypothetical protein